MPLEHLVLPQDRCFIVPENKKVFTSYVALEDIILDCKERMAIGDVENAIHKLMAAAPGQPFPSPYGYWQASKFHIKDGRHAYVAALMLGYSHLLVSYLEN